MRVSFFINGLHHGQVFWTTLDGLLRSSENLSPYTRHRERVLYALADLARHARDGSPTFVFLHVISPHEPFVFGSAGEDVSPHRKPFKINRIFADPETSFSRNPSATSALSASLRATQGCHPGL